MARRLHRAHGGGGHRIPAPAQETLLAFPVERQQNRVQAGLVQAEGIRVHVAGDGLANAQINMFCAGIGSKSSQPADVHNGYVRASIRDRCHIK